jgi:hypothetical protein
MDGEDVTFRIEWSEKDGSVHTRETLTEKERDNLFYVLMGCSSVVSTSVLVKESMPQAE